MQPRLQRVEGKPPVEFDHQLAVNDKSLERSSRQGFHDLGEIAIKGFSGLPHQPNDSPCLNARQRKPSHFGSNCHRPGSVGESFGRLRFHRGNVQRRGKNARRSAARGPSCVHRDALSPSRADWPTSAIGLGSKLDHGETHRSKRAVARKLFLLLTELLQPGEVFCFAWGASGIWRASGRLRPILRSSPRTGRPPLEA